MGMHHLLLTLALLLVCGVSGASRPQPASPRQKTPIASPRPKQPALKPKPPALKPKPPATSRLWGTAGERWSAAGRLLDYSYAGYGAGDAPLPTVAQLGKGGRLSVKDFGARGDGKADDSRAIQAAIDAAGARPLGADVYMPPGTYVVSAPIGIRHSNVVLRGAGPAKTRVYIRNSLADVTGDDNNPDPCTGELKSSYSFGGGFVSILGKSGGVLDTENHITDVAGSAQRGDTRLLVKSSAGIKAGDVVRLFMYDPPDDEAAIGNEGNVVCKGGKWVSSSASAGAGAKVQAAGFNDPAAAAAGTAPPTNGTAAVLAAMLPYMKAATRDFLEEEAAEAAEEAGAGGGRRRRLLATAGSLTADLYANIPSTFPGPESELKEQGRFSFRVASVGEGWVEFERPLPYNVRTKWRAQLHRHAASVQHSGIQDLTIKFKWTEYPGHLHERGYNGIGVYGVAHCWVRNVEVVNADSGLFLGDADWVTLDRVTVSVERNRYSGARSSGDQRNGHHAIMVTGSQDVLVARFAVLTRYFHDLTAGDYSLAVVFSGGRGYDLNMDCHRRGPYATLFTDIDVGKGRRPYDSSGRGDRGAHTASLATWWGIRASAATEPLRLPPCDFGPRLNFVAAGAGDACASMGPWVVESLDPARLAPPNLHQAMVDTRAQRLRLKPAAA